MDSRNPQKRMEKLAKIKLKRGKFSKKYVKRKKSLPINIYKKCSRRKAPAAYGKNRLCEDGVLEQNFKADQHQDDAAEHLGLALEQGAKTFAEIGADQRTDQGGDGDDDAGREDLHLQKGEADADSEGIDAGRHRLGQDGREGEDSLAGILVLVGMDCLPHHLAADEGQQDKGNPVVDRGDKRGKGAPQKVTDQRHHSLEQPKHKRPAQCLAKKAAAPHLAGNTHAVGGRDGKGVHRKSKGNHQKVQQKNSPYLFFTQ